MVRFAVLATATVVPSGAACAVAAMPMEPLAPGRFSTTPACPSANCIPSPTSRAKVSLKAPGV